MTVDHLLILFRHYAIVVKVQMILKISPDLKNFVAQQLSIHLLLRLSLFSLSSLLLYDLLTGRSIHTPLAV